MNLMNTTLKSLLLLVLIAFCFSACDRTGTTEPPAKKPKTKKPKLQVDRPAFDADAAYAYVEEQLAFGPRVPGTPAQAKCANWLKTELELSADKVYVQEDRVILPGKNKELPMFNVIGSFNPSAKNRVLLCAHWDTRPVADQDDERKDEPIPGANDGGSGTAVLLEIAKQLKAKPVKQIGVDIVLFDVEDYGDSGVADSYCLGSQYWSRNPHIPGYKANFGILLDMVGAKGSVFLQEANSISYARNIVKDVWNIGHALGYSSFFLKERTGAVTDDHLYVNRIAKIPTIDIIQYDPNIFSKGFGDYWHTHEDDISIIDRTTLKVVGETVLATVYMADK